MKDVLIYNRREDIVIREMVPGDANIIFDTYLSYGWHPQLETYRKYFEEQTTGARKVFIAEYQGRVSGLCTLVIHPDEGPWGGKHIPEIVDLSVFCDVRGRGIGNFLLDVVEAEAAKLAPMVYLAVGLHAGYGPAQRIYAKRGYIPDGSGAWYQNKVLEPYTECVNDDDLLLYLSKEFS